MCEFPSIVMYVKEGEEPILVPGGSSIDSHGSGYSLARKYYPETGRRRIVEFEWASFPHARTSAEDKEVWCDYMVKRFETCNALILWCYAELLRIGVFPVVDQYSFESFPKEVRKAYEQVFRYVTIKAALAMCYKENLDRKQVMHIVIAYLRTRFYTDREADRKLLNHSFARYHDGRYIDLRVKKNGGGYRYWANYLGERYSSAYTIIHAVRSGSCKVNSFAVERCLEDFPFLSGEASKYMLDAIKGAEASAD